MCRSLGQLNEIFSKSNTVNNLYKRGGKHNDTRLYKQFCEGIQLEKLKAQKLNLTVKRITTLKLLLRQSLKNLNLKKKKIFQKLIVKLKDQKTLYH